jgi:hypothetical protein
MRTPATGVQEWWDIDWTTVEKDVHGLRRRIYRASQTWREVPVTRINQPRSRVRGKLSSTVLKTNTLGDWRVEFNPFRPVTI